MAWTPKVVYSALGGTMKRGHPGILGAMAHALGELEKSKLLNELALMPGCEQRRIKTATERGVMLDDAHERDIQRARLAQMPWLRPLLPVMYLFFAGQAWNQIASQTHQSALGKVWAWFAAIGFTVTAIMFVRQWWRMRGLRKRLDTSTSPAR